MGSTKKLMAMMPAALFAAVIAIPNTALAADLLDPPIIEEPEIITHASGWYLRGDITYDFNDMDEPEYGTPWGGTVPFNSASIDNTWDVGIGIGYQISDYFRVDLTGEYLFEADFTGTTVGYCDDAAQIAGELNCASAESSSFDAFKLLANAYVDMGNYSGLTPYVGAGIGGAYVRWNDLDSVTTCTQIVVVCPGGGATQTILTTQAGIESWRFAWALHAGFSYDLAENTKLDLGYTYSRIEGGDMFEWAGIGGVQGRDDGIESHVIRAGLRYEIW